MSVATQGSEFPVVFYLSSF